MPRLEFSHVHSYVSKGEGITLPLVLRSGEETVDLLAQVDTGASNCLFEREHGEMLNLDIEAGSEDIRDGDWADRSVRLCGYGGSAGPQVRVDCILLCRRTNQQESTWT